MILCFYDAKFPVGKRKPGCEAGVVAMTTKTEEMWMRKALRAVQGLEEKARFWEKKVELVTGI